jgi:hypothetical protein
MRMKTALLVATSALLLSAGAVSASPAKTKAAPHVSGCVPMNQPTYGMFMEPTYHYRCGMGATQVRDDRPQRDADRPRVNAPVGLRDGAGFKPQ